MEVCEVCGAFLIVGDAQSRVDDHLQGKQHVGYAKIKSTLEDMKVCRVIYDMLCTGVQTCIPAVSGHFETFIFL